MCGYVSRSVMPESVNTWTIAHRLLCPWILQEKILEWVAVPSSRIEITKHFSCASIVGSIIETPKKTMLKNITCENICSMRWEKFSSLYPRSFNKVKRQIIYWKKIIVPQLLVSRIDTELQVNILIRI